VDGEPLEESIEGKDASGRSGLESAAGRRCGLRPGSRQAHAEKKEGEKGFLQQAERV
jgi:hypothetical protein